MSPCPCTVCHESSVEVAAARGGAFDDADAELRRLIREGLERGRNRQELWMGSGRGSAFGGSIGRCVPPVGLEPTLDGF
jgi:hypothetical protein